MRAWVAVTDRDWFRFLHERRGIDEVNFWQPGGEREFRILSIGQPLLFKLHYPDHFVVGGGFFRHATRLPVSLAWESFEQKNGVASLEEMRRRIERYRRVPPDPRVEYTIGCILLQEPFFFDQRDWIPAPRDFHRTIVQGKTYDLTDGIGRELWEEVLTRRAQGHFETELEVGQPMFREGALVRQRLGQGIFRVMITDLYQRRCAVTREKALPVLQAAHIRPVSHGGVHQIGNGLLLRSDVHALLDRGYVTVTPDHKFRVSRRLRADFDNGEHYLQLNDSSVWLPPDAADRPSRELLEWHGDHIFKG
jgi:putative restriction endonuclease